MVKGANMGVADLIKAGKRFFRRYIGRINGAAQSFLIRATTSSKIPRMTIFLFCASPQVINGPTRPVVAWPPSGCQVLIKHKGPGPIAGRTDSGTDTGGAGADYQNVYIFSNG